MGRRLARIGLPDHAMFSLNPLLPNDPTGTPGGLLGGAGAPPATPPVVAPALPTPPAAGAPAIGPNGYVENTPLEQLPVEQREAYWKHYAKTHRAERDQHAAELAALKPKAEQYDALAAASRTDQERAIEAARTEATTAARAAADAAARDRYAPALVQSRLESALAGRLTAAQVTALMPTLNVAALLDANGLPDDAKVAAFAAAIPTGPATPVAPINLGAGRTTPVVSGGLQGGVDLYAERHKKRTN